LRLCRNDGRDPDEAWSLAVRGDIDSVQANDVVRIVYAAAQNASVPTPMPQSAVTSLLFVSHAALLGSKIYDKMVRAKRSEAGGR